MILIPEKNKLILSNLRPFIIAILFIACFGVSQSARAATSTVRGAAWLGDQYKYVYFDCLDDVTGNQLDVTGNLTPPGFLFYSVPCTNTVHHVSIDSNSNFSGDAWNYSLGLISFAGSATVPDGYGFNSHCPNTCNSSNSCWACYDPTDQKVYGWARVDGTEDWLRLDSATTTPVMNQNWDYLANSVLPGHGILPGDFVGDASSGLGWLSFNCESEFGGAGNCAARPYKVYISNLQIGHLSAPNWNYSEACSEGALKAVLKWNIRSGAQAGYEVVVNDDPSFATSTGEYICWSGVKTPSVASQYIIPNTDVNCHNLDYNKNYYWWVRLYYLEGEEYKPTAWYQFGAADDHNGLLDEQTNGDPDSNIRTFTTYRHEFTEPYFTWSPLDVLVGTSTDFVSDSQFYTDASPASPQSCFGSYCDYFWSTTDAEAVISNPTGVTTSIIFFHATGTTITLRLTDSDNYVCSMFTTLRINYGLPIWREVKAE
ncbi:MAG: hypothetical protein NTY31_01055 [Candidatus Falkowbacteria bacterium]|nr:hypothetical protein [Candidatus Falkowbacteria bacterium]